MTVGIKEGIKEYGEGVSDAKMLGKADVSWFTTDGFELRAECGCKVG